MTTRTELIARLRGRVQNNYYSLQDMKDALAMLEADDNLRQAIKQTEFDAQSELDDQNRTPPTAPAVDNAYGYAKQLAESLFKTHFASEDDYASGRIVWEVQDTTLGVLTQIDNMVCGLVKARAIEAAEKVEPVAWRWKDVDGLETIMSIKPPHGAEPLYLHPTAPAQPNHDHLAESYQQKWQAGNKAAPAQQPLTDEQIKACLQMTHLNDVVARLPQGWKEFTRAIEAAHGITGEKT